MQTQREEVACNLCESRRTVLWDEVRGARLVRCLDCGLVYTNPRPALSVLMGSYEEEYSEAHEEPELLRQRQVMYRLELAEILRRRHGGRFLDIGCGTGEFLSLLRDHFEVYGTDVSRHYIEQARSRYGLEHLSVGQLGEVGFDDSFFDVVQMRGVLQHVPDPLSQLREAFRITKPGGMLIISATPNIASPAARCFRGHFRLLAPDQMLYDFSPRTLQALLAKAGFRVQGFTYPYVNTPYFRWYQPLQFVYLTAALRLKRALGQDASAIKSPPFFRSMMNCYAIKP